MTYLLSLIIIFIGIIKRNSKLVALLILIFLWILFGWNFANADYDNYVRGFSWAAGPLRYKNELGTQLLYKLFRYFHLEYRHFIVVFSFVGFVLIYKSIKQYTDSIALVLVLYFIFPFIIDVVQSRSFIVIALVIYGLKYIILDYPKGNMKFLLFVLLASTIHYSALFYILLLLIKYKKVKDLVIVISVILLLSSIVIYTDILQKFLYLFFTVEKVDNWFSNRFNYGILLALLIHGVSIFILFYLNNKREIIIYNKRIEVNEKQLIFISNIYKMNIVLLLLFPLYVFNMIFFRLFRNLLILNYIAYAIGITTLIYKKDEKIVFLFFVLSYAIGLFLYFIIYSFYDSVFLPVFNNNLIF